jgi:bacterioferritin (cytochrome b1)
MVDKHRRAIAALEVELAMTEAHADKLSTALTRLTDSNQRDELTALVKEESDRAEQLRQQLRLLRDAA